MTSLSIVIPCLNVEKNIFKSFEIANRVAKSVFGNYEIMKL